jgi:hypothetical protein
MLVTACSTREYFREALGEAMRTSGIDVTEYAQVYIVHLLSEFTRTDHVYGEAEAGESTALALMLSNAENASPEAAAKIYKHMGDSSLYHSGFFTESVQREMVNVDYYVAMGGRAYQSLSRLVRDTKATAAVLYDELSARFEDLVALLGNMSLHGEKTAPERLSDERILQLIERFRRTGKKEVRETLAAHGVVLAPGGLGDSEIIH